MLQAAQADQLQLIKTCHRFDSTGDVITGTQTSAEGSSGSPPPPASRASPAEDQEVVSVQHNTCQQPRKQLDTRVYTTSHQTYDVQSYEAFQPAMSSNHLRRLPAPRC